METIAFVVFPVVLVVAAVLGLKREDVWLRRRARRYRELELEGIEQLRRDDPYPEEKAVEGGFLREPNGNRANAEDVLRQELRRAREHMRKGAPCLL